MTHLDASGAAADVALMPRPLPCLLQPPHSQFSPPLSRVSLSFVFGPPSTRKAMSDLLVSYCLLLVSVQACRCRSHEIRGNATCHRATILSRHIPGPTTTRPQRGCVRGGSKVLVNINHTRSKYKKDKASIKYYIMTMFAFVSERPKDTHGGINGMKTACRIDSSFVNCILSFITHPN